MIYFDFELLIIVIVVGNVIHQAGHRMGAVKLCPSEVKIQLTDTPYNWNFNLCLVFPTTVVLMDLQGVSNEKKYTFFRSTQWHLNFSSLLYLSIEPNRFQLAYTRLEIDYTSSSNGKWYWNRFKKSNVKIFQQPLWTTLM